MRKRYTLGVVVLLIAVVAGLELTGVTHFFRKKPAAVVSGSSYSPKGERSSGKGSTSQSSDSNSGGSYSTSKENTSSAVLLTPSGDFVSNHHPNLSNSPAPNTEASVCNTTPGASCKIIFIKDSMAKSLPPQIADPTGFTNWNWKLQDIGLTAGTWKIQAVATLNGQSKSAYDAMDLVVSP